MRYFVSVLTFCLALCACGVDDAAAGPDPGSHLLETVQDLQLLTSGQGFSPADGYVPSGFSTVATTGNGQLGFADAQVQIKNGPWMVPVTVPLGTPISGFGTQLIDNGGATPNTVKVELVSSTSGTIGSITSTGNGNDQGWTSTFANSHTTIGGEMLWFRCSPKTSSGAWATANSMIEILSLFVAPPLVRTLVIPVQPVINTRTASLGDGMGNVISGNVEDPIGGFVQYIPLPLPVGSVIKGWRVRVQDSAHSGASSQIASRLLSTTNNNHVPVSIVQSLSSTGNGVEQTIEASGVNWTTSPMTQYWISVFDYVGTADGFVRRLEVDVN